MWWQAESHRDTWTGEGWEWGLIHSVLVLISKWKSSLQSPLLVESMRMRKEADSVERDSSFWLSRLTRIALILSRKPRSGELQTQKLKSHLVRTQSLNVLPLKPGVGQYIVIHAPLTARDFLLAYFYPSSPFTSIFSKTSPDFFPVLAVANTGSCVGPQNKICHPARCRFLCWVPGNINRLKKHDLWYDDLWNEWLGDRVKFVFSPDVILCGWLGLKHQPTN